MSLKAKTTFDLVMRQKVLQLIIAEAEEKNDPRLDKEGGVRDQLAIIKAELKLRQDENKPQNKEDENGNLTVGLKTLKMDASNELR